MSAISLALKQLTFRLLLRFKKKRSGLAAFNVFQHLGQQWPGDTAAF